MSATPYASVSDVQARMTRTLSSTEESICEALLSDAAAMIDETGTTASAGIKLIVSCRMVIRSIGDGTAAGVPMGATQGSMSALGYSQSWTLGNGGGVGELYFSKLDRHLLKIGNKIGSYSPVEELAPTEGTEESEEPEETEADES